ncbi:FAD-dependent monooxygenase [Actinomadura flavalba]|uniref:FAD-dependent monooxygenase n=1 Tax=Actinomadura flavalba TaxID=1120938 RepID=UPI000382BE0F|nr:FAD-dependent monooxygenase [Actinomadura flavalba]
MPNVLVSGASVAGPALAYWLGRGGWDVTVVERFERLRDGGQNVDVRGAGREVVRRMGLEDAALAAGTGETGTEIVDDSGRSLAYAPQGGGDSDGWTADMEILRGELSRLLHDRSAEHARYVFGDEITALDDRDGGVDVTFRGGGQERFDVVVLAEGLSSRTRDLVFPGVRPRHLGLCMAYLTIPRTSADNDRWRWYQAGAGRTATLRPDNTGTIRATLSFLTDARGLEDLTPSDQAHVLRRTFHDAAWEVPRVLDALDTAPFYFESTGQVRLPAWSRGRIALLGDAAYCASPLSGMGTTLALTGAYVLAGQLTTNPHAAAFAHYERVMRPYVVKAQHLPPGTPRLAHPRTPLGVRSLRTAAKLATSPPARTLTRLTRRVPAPAEKFTLPDHPSPGR